MAKDMNVLKGRMSAWLQENVKSAGGAVIGLSGGVDSSVVAVLAKMALGDNVLGVIMPCNSKDEDTEHARMLAQRFGIKTEFVDLDHAFKTLKQSLPAGKGVAEANLKPRLRMLTLYYFANLNNYLVLGTGNRSELMIGYFTKYGDGGVDLLPIAGLYKSEVVELARVLGVPDEIIKKPPSAGLWAGQTDEAEIGMTYDELDSILQAIDKNETGGIDSEKLDRVRSMIKESEHKRGLAAIFEQ
jgi:NAD+ synthase